MSLGRQHQTTCRSLVRTKSSESPSVSFRLEIDRVASSRPRSSKNGMLVKEKRPKELMACLSWSFIGRFEGDSELFWLSDKIDPRNEPIEPELP